MICNRIASPEVWNIAIGTIQISLVKLESPKKSIDFDEVEADAATVQELHALGKNMPAILSRDAAIPAFSMKLHVFDGSMPDILHDRASPSIPHCVIWTSMDRSDFRHRWN